MSSSTLALIAANSAVASCNPAPVTVQNDSSYGQHVSNKGDPATGDSDGCAPSAYTINNDISVSQSGNASESSYTQEGALFLQATGGDGSSDTKNDGTSGGDGSTQTINNTGSVTVSSITWDSAPDTTLGVQPGIYDSNQLTTGIYVAAAGGKGADANVTVVGGGNGGRGGDGGYVTITNSGSVNVNTNAENGLVGIYGASIGGPGGDQDKAATGDQFGGNGGDAKEVTITNSGAISVSSGSAAAEVWGIGAEGLGNNGGDNASSGGTGALITITNTGSVIVNANGTALTSVRGISAHSEGGEGTFSSDGSDQGGKGEGAKVVTLTNGANITVESNNLSAPTDASEQSAGIVLLSHGGDGGEGPQDIEVFDTQIAGQGGDGSTLDGTTSGQSRLSVQDGAFIATQGDYLAGIYAATEGGNGGDGREDSAGGDGGNGGELYVEIIDASSVQTSGLSAAGIIARAGGGAGGDVLSSSGIVDTGASEAGDGGASGNAIVSLGFTFDEANDNAILQNGPATITTTGDLSTGVLVQAVGGGGGGVTSNFELFGQPASDSGGGGAGQTALVQGFANVTTFGSASAGIMAQSVGGGGGVPGADSGLIAVGGNGGVGANSSFATIDFSGSVTTQGDESIGILAQGIGGGGGAAAGAEGVASVGGQGGGGGIGGDIDVRLPATQVSTAGDFSYGVLAQSVGGGGGDGGSVFDLTLLPTGDPIPAVGVGGSGATGGAGDNVNVSNVTTQDQTVDIVGALNITTSGSNAHGILAHSIGGGGGSGGNAVGLSTFSPTSFQIAGAADGGGDGDSTSVLLDDFSILTSGSHAAGIISQSVGGGGGIGGSASAKNAQLILSISASVGGIGGDGGDAGAVDVSLSNGSITTGGNGSTDAFGIVAQAIGGGGGIAGSATSDAAALALDVDDIPPVGVSVSAAIGGTGGSGGRGGPDVSGEDAVLVALTATSLQTGGDGSTGIVAQSIGGGGGTGGSASSTAGVIGGSESVGGSLSFAVGGFGGSGGHGDTVDVSIDATSTIDTFGDYANGILAQSIGGGGGSGGPGSATTSSAASGFSLSATMTVGGLGNGGGTGGAVSIDLAQDSALSTYGSGARGVVAQSIGAGGGASQGSAFGVSVAGSSGEGTDGTDASVDLDVAVGGNGGSGGDGGTVSVTGHGVVETTGNDADGYLVQSIGGGGGLAGSAGSDADDDDDSSGVGTRFGGDDESTSYDFEIALGGSGGSSGHGGDITFDYRGQTATQGDYADGIVVQSIGGGGGVGGTATANGSEATANINIAVGGQGGTGGNGGDITAIFNDSNSNSVSTQGYGAYGVLLQSIGGGGGQGADGSGLAEGNIGIGGGAGGSGNGGSITVSDYFNVLTTQGDDAIAFVAQSIGGGGGVGLAGSSASTQDDDSHQINLTLGGSLGSQASDVSISFGAYQMYTEGDRAYGIVAQSIAGGGGIASVGDSSGISSVSVGQSTSSSNLSGNVDVAWTDPSKTMTTSGDGAHAIIAQSISGGGGIVGDSSTGDYATSIADQNTSSTGTAGAVQVTSTGSILTHGENAFGIIAQSLGGNGGLVSGPNGTTIGVYSQPNNGHGGPVTVTADGQIETQGEGSIAIFAQSLGNTQDAITVTVSNIVSGGTGTGQAAGIVVNGGNGSNELTVESGGSVSAGSGVAVRYLESELAAGGLTVYNSGQISGSVTGTANADQAANAAAATAVSVPTVRLNNTQTGVLSEAEIYQAHVSNAGALIVGTRLGLSSDVDYSFSGLRVEGDLMQSNSGTLVMAANFETGTSDSLHVTGDVTLDGSLEIEASSIASGVTTRLLTTDGTISGALTGVNSQIFQYDIAQTQDVLDVTVQAADFDQAAFGLTRSQSEIANHLEMIFDNGDAGFGTTFAALEAAAMDGNDTLANAYTSLTPQASAAGAAMNFRQNRLRFNDLLGCQDHTADDNFDGQANCLRLIVSSEAFDQSADGNALGYDGTINTVGLGGQHQLDSGMIVSGAIGYENSRFDYGTSNSRTDGDTYHIEAALTQSWSNFSLSVALGASNGSFDVSRNIDIPGQSATATGSYDATSIAGRLRAAYRLPTQQGHLRAMLDLDVINAQADAYTETGAGALNLQIDESNQTGFVASPTLENGHVFALANGMQLKAYGSVGMSFSSLDNFATQAQFASASAGLGSVTNEVAVAPISGNIAIGAQLIGAENLSAGLEYNGSFADGYSGHRASLNLRWLF